MRARMQPYDEAASRTSIDLTVNSDLLQQALDLEIDLPAALEHALRRAIQQERERRWVEENRAAIDDYNRLVETNGGFGDDWRTL